MQVEYTDESGNPLCFRHAILAAQDGENISAEVNDYESSGYFDDTGYFPTTMFKMLSRGGLK